MEGFASQIGSRVASARENLRLAQEADEPYLVDVHLGELESLARIAAENGVTVPGLQEALLAHGIDVTPPAGLSHLIDLDAARLRAESA